MRTFFWTIEPHAELLHAIVHEVHLEIRHQPVYRTMSGRQHDEPSLRKAAIEQEGAINVHLHHVRLDTTFVGVDNGNTLSASAWAQRVPHGTYHITLPQPPSSL